MGAMHSRRHFASSLQLLPRFSALSILLLIAGGCLSSHHSANQTTLPQEGKSPPDAAPAATRPDGMDAANVNPADLIAHRAEQYSREMEPAIARRNAAIDPSPAAQPAPAQPGFVQPSLVQWGDPSASQLSLLPGYLLRSGSEPPAPAPIETSPSSANQPLAQLASLKMGATSNAVVAATAPVREDISDNKPQIASNEPAVAPVETARSEMDNPADSGPSANASALDARIAKRVHDYPSDLSAQFDYQMMAFINDQPVPNLTTLSSLPTEDRDMLSAIMDGLSMYRNNLRADNNMLLSKQVRPLLDMADRLRSLADLTIPTVALCSEVRGFGNYTPFDGDPPHFSAGVDHPAILYCEVQNFSARLNDTKMWQTELGQDAVLYTEGGMEVWRDKPQSVVDSARNRRQDFFIVQRMRLPATLPIGRYLLKVTIEDKQSHHVAEATQPLLIVAE
jgi:hypothetical protein